MSKNDNVRNKGGVGLGDRIDAFEAKRSRPVSPDQAQSLGAGYRVLANMTGGVLGGIGFGWLFDHFIGTTPWGMVGGVLIGSTVSIYAVVRSAGRVSKKAEEVIAPVGPDQSDDEDED